jgi:hypothetical protein
MLLFGSEIILEAILWMHVGIPGVVGILKVLIACQPEPPKPPRGGRRR